MKRNSGGHPSYQPLQLDCQRNERDLERLDIEEKNHVPSQGFGTIQQVDTGFYWVRTLELSGVGAKVSRDLIVDPSQDLQEGDHIKLSYFKQEPTLPLSKCQVTIKDFIGVVENSVGTITQNLDDGLVVNQHVWLSFNMDMPEATREIYKKLELNALVDYCAVRNDSRPPFKYRCLWARRIDTDDLRLDLVMPKMNGIMDQLSKAGQNIGGICIQMEELVFMIDYPVQDLDSHNDPPERQLVKDLVIANISKNERLLINMSITKDYGTDQVQFSILAPSLAAGCVTIRALSSADVRIQASCRQPGVFMGSIVLNFDGDLTLMRRLRVVAGNREFTKSYGTDANKTKLVQTTKKEHIFANLMTRYTGPLNLRENAMRMRSYALGQFPLPPNIGALLKLDTKEWDNYVRAEFEYLCTPLSPLNYVCRFHDLLWLDEICQFHNIQILNQHNVCLRKERGKCMYSVAGVFTIRFTILPGDRFQCTSGPLTNRLKFDGLVVRVDHDRAHIRMEDEFVGHENKEWDTTFKCSRSNYRFQHQAIAKREPNIDNDQWLFPTREDLTRQPAQVDVRLPTPLQMVRHRVKRTTDPEDGKEMSREIVTPLKLIRPDLNAVQKEALRNVLRGEHRSRPYLISGPPGTGKTTVLVEIIFQLWKLQPKARILVCTQSNSAADLILSKLVDSGRLQKQSMLRILSKQQVKNQETIPEHLRPFCTGLFELEEDIEALANDNGNAQNDEEEEEEEDDDEEEEGLNDQATVFDLDESSGPSKALRLNLGAVNPQQMGFKKPQSNSYNNSNNNNNNNNNGNNNGNSRKNKAKETTKKKNKTKKIRSSSDLSTLMRTRILISTCGTIGNIMRMNFPTDHLTHLVIDEAAQILEPDCVQAMLLMENPKSQMVMAGDVKQLGPIICWDLLKEFGFGTSLFERLLKVPGLYVEDRKWSDDHPNDWPIIPELYCELVYNYRSIPSILNLFNDQFYGGRLRSQLALPQLNYAVLHTAALAIQPSQHRSIDQGVFFLSVLGENMRRSGDPSWYNASEASVCLDIVMKLHQMGLSVENDVVLLSPYQGQVQFLRHQLQQRGLHKHRVNSVEEFQGQECAIVIVSAVRSMLSVGDAEKEVDLGFVKNPRRTNVALSRAQCMLVIVGNAPILSGDPLWRSIIEYCTQRYAFYDLGRPLLESLQ